MKTIPKQEKFLKLHKFYHVHNFFFSNSFFFLNNCLGFPTCHLIRTFKVVLDSGFVLCLSEKKRNSPCLIGGKLSNKFTFILKLCCAVPLCYNLPGLKLISVQYIQVLSSGFPIASYVFDTYA